MRKAILICLAAVIAVSGCVGTDLFKMGVGTTTVKEQAADLITTQNQNIIPSPVWTGGAFTFSLEVLNIDDVQTVKNAEIKLYDTGMCNLTGATNNFTNKEFAPLQTEFVEYKLTAPLNEMIGNMPATCPLRYKITYNFTAISQSDFQVISESRLTELQRAGEIPTFSPTQSVGRGPVKIYFDYGASLPLRNATVLPVFIWIEDKGTGILPDIDNDSLIIKTPINFTQDEGTKYCGGKFEYWKTDNANYSYYNNTGEKIPMVKKKSPQIRCSMTPTLGTEPSKTFYLTASMNYTYPLYEETSVEIKPTLTG